MSSSRRIVARRAIADTDLDLDQFVVIKGAVGFGQDGLAQAARSDHDDRIEAVAETPEVFALRFCQGHGGAHENFEARW